MALSTAEGTVHLVCVYAPTPIVQSPPEVKDQFYESLDTGIGMVPSSEHILLLGDFNARVGASVLGHHGIGKMNYNSQRLLELCCYHNLCVTNAFFQNKTCHKVSWRYPMSKHWHQLDLVITWRDSLNNVCNTRSYHSADCNTDHSLIASRVKLTPKRIYHSKQKGQPRINTCNTAYPGKIQEFAERLEESLMYHHLQCCTAHIWQERTENGRTHLQSEAQRTGRLQVSPITEEPPDSSGRSEQSPANGRLLREELLASTLRENPASLSHR